MAIMAPKNFRGSALDPVFIKRARIQTSFNVEDADLTSLKFKKEMQFLYDFQFFPGWFEKNTLLTGQQFHQM